jgi:threonine dehydrogenase-like Zn-dependent dehydrogenase
MARFDHWIARQEYENVPRALIAIAPRTPALRDYNEPELRPNDIRIASELASPKHGTELVAYRNDPVVHRPYDPALGVTMPRPPEEALERFPRPLGNMVVGVVTEAGSAVQRFRPGNRVFGHLPIRETHTVAETEVDPLPPGLSAEAAVCLDPVVMALAMRDARLTGAAQVIALDPLANRRELATRFGVDHTLDPTASGGDAGLAIRVLTGEPVATAAERPSTRLIGGYWERPTEANHLGVDVAVETAGSIQALHHAIRATRFGGTVCVISFYGRDAAGLALGEEFHVNQLQLISVRAESLPLRGAPAWTLDRLVRLAIDWLIKGRIRVDGIVSPIVPFAECVEAYRAIDEHPEQSIKLGIRFP